MATEVLKWVYELMDRMSGPADRIARSLDGVNKKLADMPVYTALAQQGLQKVVNGAERLAGLAFDMGRFGLEALAFKESSLVAFETMLGTKEAAEDFFNLAKGFGKLTPFSTKQVIDSMQQLMQAGFTKDEVPKLFQALGDVSAGRGFSTQVLDRLTLAFGQVRAKGKLMGQELNQLSEAGVGRKDMFKALSGYLGIGETAVADAIERGMVPADMALAAALDAIKARYSGGKDLGSMMLAQATSINGLLSTLKSAPEDLFFDIELKGSKGFQGIKTFLSNLVAAVSPDGATGSKLRTSIEGVLDRIGGALATVTPEALAHAFDEVVHAVEVAIKGVERFKDGFAAALGPAISFMGWLDGGKGNGDAFTASMSALGTVLGGVAGVLAVIGTGLSKFFQIPKMLEGIDWDYLGEQLKSAGIDLVKGLADGILSVIALPAKAIASVGLETVDALRNLLGIHSPSRVFAELGRNTAEGYQLGLEEGGRGATVAVEELGSARPASRRGSVVGTGEVTININIDVHGGGDDAADTVARKLSELLPSHLSSLFEQMAIEGGVA